MQGSKKLYENVCNLMNTIQKSLGTQTLCKVFGYPTTLSMSDFEDLLKKEILHYNMEKLPEIPSDESTNTSESSKKNSSSYWKDAYGLVGLKYHLDEQESPLDFVKFWVEVGDIKNSDGKPKFKILSKLALTCLCLSHGNADPERGFSLNKHLLERHGPNIDEETIISICLIKDYLIRIGGLSNIDTIPSNMLRSCRSSYQAYVKFLNDNKKAEDEQKKQAEEKKRLIISSCQQNRD